MENKHGRMRIFTYDQKKECWNKAEIVEGRDPGRWRYDAVGNLVMRRLTGCTGPLCYEYDHIKPFSKGGETSVENCQILQTKVNRFKSNLEPDVEELKKSSFRESLSVREMDFMEKMVYGDVKKPS